MSDWISRITGNGTAPWYLTVALIASCIGILGSIAILYRSYKYISGLLLQRRKRMYLTGITTAEFIEWQYRTLLGIYQSGEAIKALGSFVKIDNPNKDDAKQNDAKQDETKQDGSIHPVIARIGSGSIKYNPREDTFDGFKTTLITSETTQGTAPKTMSDKNPIDRELLYKRLPHYRQFRKIVSDQVRFPELIGYTNIGFDIDDNGIVSGFTARPRTYKETVFSCHVLQYELWKAFLKKKRLSSLLRRKSVPAARLKELPLRDLIHNGKLVEKTIKGKQYDRLVRDKEANEERAERLKKVVFDGRNRSSLCDVNLVILKITNKNPELDFNEHYKKAWSAAVGRRSENVATFPGYWSIVPSGSFEMSEKTITPKDKTNVYFQKKVRANANVVYALYREYLEEVFNLSDYEHPNGDNDMYQLKNNKHIDNLKNSDKADLIFLGVCFNLIVLRQTISFALVVRDDSVLKDVRHNDENAILDFVSLEELEQIIQNEDAVMPEFAGTYELLMNNKTVIGLLKKGHLSSNTEKNCSLTHKLRRSRMKKSRKSEKNA